MMWAENFQIFGDDRANLKSMVNDIIDEVMDVEVEPEPESLWWTSTHKAEDGGTVEVGGTGRKLEDAVCEGV